jgi:hypothetical protein
LGIADTGQIDDPTPLFGHNKVMNVHVWHALVRTVGSQLRCVCWICARNADAGALDELIAFTGRDLQQQDWR